MRGGGEEEMCSFCMFTRRGKIKSVISCKPALRLALPSTAWHGPGWVLRRSLLWLSLTRIRVYRTLTPRHFTHSENCFKHKPDSAANPQPQPLKSNDSRKWLKTSFNPPNVLRKLKAFISQRKSGFAVTAPYHTH